MTSLVRRSTKLRWMAVSASRASLPASFCLAVASGERAATMGFS